MTRPQAYAIPPMDVDAYTAHRSPVQVAAGAVAVAFVALGVLGFVPGVTTAYGAMDFAGHSAAMLFGVFAVSVLHNVVHLALGGVGLAMTRGPDRAASFLVVGGLFAAALFVYGVFVEPSSGANFLPVNTADNLLHLGAAAAMALLAVTTGRRS